jgi:nicotinate-nucleotide adenylyltransferase
MKIGIFGGTFDPPHLGHLILAQEAQEQLGLDEVLWVLTPFPPHKIGQKISALQDRIALVLLAIENNSHFSLSRVDIDRQPPHYAVDTVAILREKHPNDQFYYLMGADSLNDLPEWHEPEIFVSECDLIGVMVRHGEAIDTSQIEKIIPGTAVKLRILETPCVEISGNEIRKRVAIGRQVRYFLPDKIFHYITDHRLYQA